MCGSQLSYFVLLQHLHMLAQQEQQNANHWVLPACRHHKTLAPSCGQVTLLPLDLHDAVNPGAFICMLVGKLGSGVWRVPLTLMKWATTPCVRLNRLSKSVVRYTYLHACVCMCLCLRLHVPNMQNMKYQSDNQVCLVCTNPSLIWQMSKPCYGT